jgi:hypothetical protein
MTQSSIRNSGKSDGTKSVAYASHCLHYIRDSLKASNQRILKEFQIASENIYRRESIALSSGMPDALGRTEHRPITDLNLRRKDGSMAGFRTIRWANAKLQRNARFL